MGKGLNKPLFLQRCLQTFYIFLNSRVPHSFSRFAFALVRLLHLRANKTTIEKKSKTTSVYRLISTTIRETKAFLGFLCYCVTSIQSNRNELWEIRFWNFHSKIAIGFSQTISGRLTCIRWSRTAYNGEQSFLSLVNFPSFETPRAFFSNKTLCLENEETSVSFLLKFYPEISFS